MWNKGDSGGTSTLAVGPRLPLASLPFMFDRIREDIAAIRSKDPAARSALDIWLSYPGFHAVRLHRVANALWRGLPP